VSTLLEEFKVEPRKRGLTRRVKKPVKGGRGGKGIWRSEEREGEWGGLPRPNKRCVLGKTASKRSLDSNTGRPGKGIKPPAGLLAIGYGEVRRCLPNKQ